VIKQSSKINLLLLVTVSVFNACVNPPKYPIIPKIALISVTDSIIDQRAIISVTFSFEDGDGDLGTDANDSTCINLCLPKEDENSCYQNQLFGIFFTDNRTGCLLASGTVIPVIPPKGSSNAISGEITATVGPICCLPPDNSAGCIPNATYPRDTLYGSLRIRDKAGNFSNSVNFGPIFIDCTK
jgi:hypothetical protein